MQRTVSFGRTKSTVFTGANPIAKHQYLNRQSSLLTKAPKNASWIRQGVVERKTEYNEIWRQRQMILTSSEICFARPASDVLVDCISLADVVSVGKVDRAHDTIAEAVGKRTHQKRMSVTRIDSLEDLQAGFRDTFAFEIKVVTGGLSRSYLARVNELEECEAWIDCIKSCLKQRQITRLQRESRLSRIQNRVKDLYDSDIVRYIVVFAIFCDFALSIVQSEYVPESGTALYQAIANLDVAFFVFFALELAVNLFSNWRSLRGMPFISIPANWFQLATVILQSALFFKPIMEDFKVVRILRVFHVGNNFRSFASFNVILKALQQGGANLRGSGNAHTKYTAKCKYMLTAKCKTCRRHRDEPYS